jgi:hypothetical protein
MTEYFNNLMILINGCSGAPLSILGEAASVVSPPPSRRLPGDGDSAFFSPPCDGALSPLQICESKRLSTSASPRGARAEARSPSEDGRPLSHRESSPPTPSSTTLINALRRQLKEKDARYTDLELRHAELGEFFFKYDTV